MKLKMLFVAIFIVFTSCKNDRKPTEITKQVSNLKSDILIQSSAYKPFSSPNRKDDLSLIISGKTILEGIATFKVLNEAGEELHCETFPSKDLIQPEYQTANSVLQESHIREVVEGFFVEDLDTVYTKKNS